MSKPNISWQKNVVWRYSSYPEVGAPTLNVLIGTYPSSAEAKTESSIGTPNFRAYLHKKHLLPDHAYYFRHDSWVDVPMTLSQVWIPTTGKPTRYVYTNTVMNALSGSDPFGYFTKVPTDDLTQKVIAKIQENIKLGNADLLTSLVEANKTAAMIASTATRLASAYTSLKRVDFVGFSNALGITRSRKAQAIWREVTSRHQVSQARFEWRTHPITRRRFRYRIPQSLPQSRLKDFAADAWLEYTYGWVPLINDVYNSAKASASVGIEMGNQVRQVTASAKSFNKFFDTRFVNQFTFKGSCTREMSMRYQLHYRIENGGPSFSTAFGLDNPLSVVWEVLPFSFVVDWFLPVGQAISALSAYNGLTFVKGTVSSKQVWSCAVSATGNHWSTGGGVWHAGGYTGFFTQNITIKSRSILSTFPQYGFPRLKNPSSVSHMISALSLLKVAFR